MGSGVRAIQIKRHPEMDSTCYFVLRSDGTQEDFSYRKCIARLVRLRCSWTAVHIGMVLSRMVPGPWLVCGRSIYCIRQGMCVSVCLN